MVALYKSVCFVTVSIGEISFSLLERLEANYEWGSRATVSLGLLSSPLTRCNFRFKLAEETINLHREAVSPGREAATPSPVRG